MAAAGSSDGIKERSISWCATCRASSCGRRRSRRCCRKALNVKCNLRTVVESVWFDDTASGHFDLAIGAIVSTLLDPSDYFNAWYRTGGPQNYSFWDNKEFNGLLDQIDREVDPAKRLALVHKTEAIMEQDMPVLPVAWERINDVYCDYVKGHNPGGLFRHLRRRARGHVLARQDLRPAHSWIGAPRW